MEHCVLNIAHRGARSLAPENTLAAARKALALGADMWEVDVAVTADGALVLMHDDSLARTTDVETVFPDRAPWIFTTFTKAELDRLDAGSWFAASDPFGEIAAGHVPAEDLARYEGEPIPTVREALQFTLEHHWRINLELKAQPPPMDAFPLVEPVVALIEEMKAEHAVVLSSFNHNWLREVRRLNPRLEVAALLGYGDAQEVDWETLEFPTYSLRLSMATEDRIRRLREAGRNVNVWVVNEEENMRRLIELGVTGIFTDYPQRLSRVLQELDP